MSIYDLRNPMHHNAFRPMLSGKVEKERDLNKLLYPMIASPKVDGIRCISRVSQTGQRAEFLTRTMKPIRNKYLQARLLEAHNLSYPMGWRGMDALDGEITYGPPSNVTHPNIFNQTTSAVMSGAGEPLCTYWVFDSVFSTDKAYDLRLKEAATRVDVLDQVYKVSGFTPLLHVKLLPSAIVINAEEALLFERKCLDAGFEGVMFRKPDMGYKFGRSALTATQQHIVKFKRFEDGEAEIIGYEELMHNENEATKDAFGLTDRSSHSENLKGGSTLGALVCRGITAPYDGVEFRIGTGFDAATRQQIWDNRDFNPSKFVTYKYQACGAKDAPRFPSFKGFRGDM